MCRGEHKGKGIIISKTIMWFWYHKTKNVCGEKGNYNSLSQYGCWYGSLYHFSCNALFFFLPPTLFSTTETNLVIVANNSLHLAKSNILVSEFILLHCAEAVDKNDHIFLFKTLLCMIFRTLYLLGWYLFYLQLCLPQLYLVIFLLFPISPLSFGLIYPTRYSTYFYLGV